MVKIIMESQTGNQTTFNGECAFSVIIDLDGGDNMMSALIGEATPRDIITAVGQAIGAQIRSIVKNSDSKHKLIGILAESVSREAFKEEEDE